MEDARAAKFLASLPEVNNKQIVSVGFSMGAFRAWQVAALSDDITACIADCWMATMGGLMVPENNQLKGNSAFSMLHPYIARYLDYPDVAGLAAPKPMLVYAGEQDGLFPLTSVNEAFAKMGKIWKAFGAQDKLTTKIWPYGHVFYKEMQDEAYAWLDLQFGRK
jgi:dienelactone hydrolase